MPRIVRPTCDVDNLIIHDHCMDILEYLKLLKNDEDSFISSKFNELCILVEYVLEFSMELSEFQTLKNLILNEIFDYLN